MGMRHLGYGDDVNITLDGKQPNFGKSLRFGMEVETGWHTSEDRAKFFAGLEKHQIDKLAVSKFDRSIMGEVGACSEIVTKPLRSTDLADIATKIGCEIEALADTVSTKNCGVHIHASKAGMSPEVLWRAVTAIMVKAKSGTYYNVDPDGAYIPRPRRPLRTTTQTLTHTTLNPPTFAEAMRAVTPQMYQPPQADPYTLVYTPTPLVPPVHGWTGAAAELAAPVNLGRVELGAPVHLTRQQIREHRALIAQGRPGGIYTRYVELGHFIEVDVPDEPVEPVGTDPAEQPVPQTAGPTDEELTALHEFWTLLALRRPTKFCGRSPYSNYRQFVENPGTHDRALTIGRHTPTLEFRLFKTPRSATVLRSYAEIVASLIDFCSKVDAKYLEPPREPIVDIQEILMEECERVYVPWILEYEGVVDDHPNIPRWKRDAVQRLRTYIAEGISYATVVRDYNRNFPKEWYAVGVKYAKEIKARTEPQNPRGWARLFPVEEYCKFVLGQPRVYPALCSRLRLRKFNAYTGVGDPGPAVGSDATPFDTTTSHSNIRYGCIVRWEAYPRLGDMRVFRRYSTALDTALEAGDYSLEVRPIYAKGTSSANEQYSDPELTTFGCDEAIHLCEGAFTKGGHDE